PWSAYPPNVDPSSWPARSMRNRRCRIRVVPTWWERGGEMPTIEERVAYLEGTVAGHAVAFGDAQHSVADVRTDLAALRTDMTQSFTGLRAALKNSAAELRTEMAELRADLEVSAAELRSEMKASAGE